MLKTYKGSLTLEWYNKQKSILLADEQQLNGSEIPAPRINWVNKDEALFYEVVEDEGRGLRPYWVDRNDIRVKEARPLIHQKTYKAIAKDKPGTLAGMDTIFEVEESTHDDPTVENILIKGDNLLALNTLKKMFDNKPDDEKVKCIYIDPPYNTGSAFDDYIDSLEHSQWLTMMRDRLSILYSFLRNDGFLLTQIDDKELPYLLLLMHDFFGRDNCKVIAVKMAEPTGLKMASAIKKGNIPKLKEYIIVAGKDGIKNLDIERVPKEKWDSEYKTFLLNITKDEINTIKEIRDNEERSKLDIKVCDEILGKLLVTNLAEQYSINNLTTDIQKDNFNFENAWRIVQVASISGGAKLIADNKRKDNNNPFFSITTPQNKMYFIRSNYDLIQEIPRIKILFADDYLTVHPGDFWQDIKTTGLDNEGNVEMKQSKKPERLIYKLLRMASNENDLVLDCFGGSGTTFSVAHKMKRKWIGIENGKHCDTKIIPRLINVLKNSDQSPIIDKTNWQGGGSFKYYHLGPSIIATAEDGMGDFNWALGAEFIQESLLSSYDYTEVTNLQLPEQLYALPPKIGVQKVGNHTRVGIISLNPPKGDAPMMSYDEIKALYDTIKAALNPNYINMFTNRGIEIAADSKPDDLEIIKVPHAIFAELEK